MDNTDAIKVLEEECKRLQITALEERIGRLRAEITAATLVVERIPSLHQQMRAAEKQLGELNGSSNHQ